MSAEYDHLAPECREEANLPTLERIRRIQAERWIGYPRAELVLNRLNELLHYPQRDRMPCLLLYAATGMGKTKILRKFRREHPDIELRVVTADKDIDPAEENISLAVRYGEGDWPHLSVTPLLRPDVFPVCSPEFVMPPFSKLTP